ncbi:hypothetical protein ABK040_011013 [Willaertia magna]
MFKLIGKCSFVVGKKNMIVASSIVRHFSSSLLVNNKESNNQVFNVFMFTGQGIFYLKQDDEIIKQCFNNFNFPSLSNIPNIENPPTSIAQPIILLQSMILFDTLQKKLQKKGDILENNNLFCMLGHSLGEFTALCASGALTIDEALQLVHIRGKSMENQFTNKKDEERMSMKAIINTPTNLMNNIEQWILNNECNNNNNEEEESFTLFCDIANINTPQQVVLSGDSKDIEKQINFWQEKYKCKLRTIPLNVHLPFHSKYMRNVANDIENVYKTIFNVDSVVDGRKLNYPIVSNVNGKMTIDLNEMINNSIIQVYKPVLWNISIKNIYNKVVEIIKEKETNNAILRFIEIGPQKKLEPMISKCLANSNNLKENIKVESKAITSMTDLLQFE